MVISGGLSMHHAVSFLFFFFFFERMHHSVSGTAKKVYIN